MGWEKWHDYRTSIIESLFGIRVLKRHFRFTLSTIILPIFDLLGCASSFPFFLLFVKLFLVENSLHYALLTTIIAWFESRVASLFSEPWVDPLLLVLLYSDVLLLIIVLLVEVAFPYKVRTIILQLFWYQGDISILPSILVSLK